VPKSPEEFAIPKTIESNLVPRAADR